MTDPATLAISVVSLIAAIVAIFVGVEALRRSDRNTSLATLVTLNEGLSQAWRHYVFGSSQAERDMAFGDLINLLEIGCAAHLSGSIHDTSKKLLEEHLCGTLKVLMDNDDARAAILELKEAAMTFEHLTEFLRLMRRSGRALPIQNLIL